MATGLFWATGCLCAFLFVLALDMMSVFSRKNQFIVEGRTVVITGGSQGMGKGLAKLLAHKGANVVIVARNQQKLDEALQEIHAAAKDAANQRFLAISADVTKPEQNERIIHDVTAWNHGNPPDVVWANAGMSTPMLFLDTPVDTLRQQMEVNYMAAAYLAQSTLKSWVQPSTDQSQPASPLHPRHFIMTSSSACFVGVAGYAPYAPPKAALRSLADTLRSEVNLYNGARRSKDAVHGPAADIKVHCVCPGTILSPGHEDEQRSKHAITKLLEAGDPAQSEDEVARAAVGALERGGYLITTQYLGHAMRASALAGSPRDRWLLDTVSSCITSVAWLFVGPHLERTVYGYGAKHGLSHPSPM